MNWFYSGLGGGTIKLSETIGNIKAEAASENVLLCCAVCAVQNYDI